MTESTPSGAVADLLKALRGTELEYVLARSRSNTNQEAYKAAGISKSTYYMAWSTERRAQLNEVAEALRYDRLLQVHELLKQALPDAMVGLIKLSKDRNKNIKIRAIEGVLDRGIGKPTQTQRHEGSVGLRLDDLFGKLPPDICAQLRDFLAGAIAEGDDS